MYKYEWIEIDGYEYITIDRYEWRKNTSDEYNWIRSDLYENGNRWIGMHSNR